MALGGRIKVVKDTSQRRLAAGLCTDERMDEVRDGFLLMPVGVRQNKADIFASASGKRILVHGRTDARTSH